MQTVITGQRRHQRRLHKETLEITVPSHPQKGTRVAISSNISEGGACLYTFKPLEEGQEIIFKSALSIPCERASVRWIRQCNQNIYRAGVQFSA